MRRTAHLLPAAILIVSALNLSAQMPNLAGTWTRIADSGASAPAGAPDALTIAQDSKTLTMDAQNARGNETTFTFNFDGTDSKKTMTDGNGNQFELVTRAKWDGSTLRATMTRNPGGTGAMVTLAFSLDASGHLVVATSHTPRGSNPIAMTSSYKKT